MQQRRSCVRGTGLARPPESKASLVGGSVATSGRHGCHFLWNKIPLDQGVCWLGRVLGKRDSLRRRSGGRAVAKDLMPARRRG